MNPYVNTLKFEVKVNIERALARDVLRKQEALSEAEIEQFRPQLEAALYLLNFPDQSENQLAEQNMQVRAYLETEVHMNQFMDEFIKLRQK